MKPYMCASVLCKCLCKVGQCNLLIKAVVKRAQGMAQVF